MLCVVLLAFGQARRAPAPGPTPRRSRTSRASASGFIAVELALLQHLTLLLGHPIFTLSILLFTLLAAGGLGSSFSATASARRSCAA